MFCTSNRVWAFQPIPDFRHIAVKEKVESSLASMETKRLNFILILFIQLKPAHASISVSSNSQKNNICRTCLLGACGSFSARMYLYPSLLDGCSIG